MSIEHHPTDELLAAFAAGQLDLGQHVAIATHLRSCVPCRAFCHSMEQVGGALLADQAPAAMSERALAEVEARLNAPGPTRPAVAAASVEPTELAGLPSFVRRYRFGAWTWIAPSVHLRPIALPDPSETRVFLLRARPGTKLLQHSHTGVEMTCVLSGAFTQNGSRYGSGDFGLGDESIDHEPVVAAGEECICLIALQGQLRLKGLLGRIVQPFIRL